MGYAMRSILASRACSTPRRIEADRVDPSVPIPSLRHSSQLVTPVAERVPNLTHLAFGAALLGAGTMVLEIAFTRLFSVLLFYHYVFLVLAVALLGLGLGAA